MINIAITMTATMRPVVIHQTLESFYLNMLDSAHRALFKLFINVDPCFRADPSTQRETASGFRRIVKMCGDFIPLHNIVANCSLDPSFPKAFKWVWEQAITQPNWEPDFIFHLEDDWELVRKVDLYDMITLMRERDPKLLILRLSQFPTGIRTSKHWNKLLNWNDEYFQVPDNLRGLLGFCGHPSLIKPFFVRQAIKVLDGEHNPEKHIKGHNPIMKPLYDNYKFGVYSPQQVGPTIKDLGRAWMIKNGYRKQGQKANFHRWEKKNG